MGEASRRKRDKHDNRQQRPGIGRYAVPIVATAGLLAVGAYEYFFGHNTTQNQPQQISTNRPGVVSSNSPSTSMYPTVYSSSSPTTTDSSQDFKFKYTLDQVRSREISPQTYIDQLYELPEVRQSMKEGMLKGFFYEPTDQELEKFCRKCLPVANTPEREKIVDEVVKDSIYSFRRSPNPDRKIAGASIFPDIIWTFGTGLPHYINIYPLMFTTSSVENDDDFRSLVKHELRHVKDYYSGIILDDITLSFYTLKPETFRLDFLSLLSEVRAWSGNIKDMVREYIRKGNYSASSRFVHNMFSAYLNYMELFKKYKTTELEERIRKLQLDSLGIKLEKKDNTFTLDFDIDGVKGSAKF